MADALRRECHHPGCEHRHAHGAGDDAALAGASDPDGGVSLDARVERCDRCRGGVSPSGTPASGGGTPRDRGSRVSPTSPLRLRMAAPADAALVLSFIRQLAEYERAPNAVVATEDDIRATLVSEPKRAEVILAFEGEEPVGFALFFHNYSTWLGRAGL